jgi:5-methylcytosine-specific restriction endonuclease McrA
VEDYFMLSKKVITSNDFLSLDINAQALYFLLCCNAMKGGKINNLYSIARANFNKKEDIECLIDRNFIEKTKDTSVYKIVHWEENNGFYKNAKERRTYEYQQWRKFVIDRDKKCVMCGSKNDLHAHHIKEFSKYPELRTDISNGIALCKKCHIKIHKKEKANVKTNG